jgi:hypothetical protein
MRTERLAMVPINVLRCRKFSEVKPIKPLTKKPTNGNPTIILTSVVADSIYESRRSINTEQFLVEEKALCSCNFIKGKDTKK